MPNLESIITVVEVRDFLFAYQPLTFQRLSANNTDPQKLTAVVRVGARPGIAVAFVDARAYFETSTPSSQGLMTTLQ